MRKAWSYSRLPQCLFQRHAYIERTEIRSYCQVDPFLFIYTPSTNVSRIKNEVKPIILFHFFRKNRSNPCRAWHFYEYRYITVYLKNKILKPCKTKFPPCNIASKSSCSVPRYFSSCNHIFRSWPANLICMLTSLVGWAALLPFPCFLI